LNEAQLNAIQIVDGPLSIVAGPGSGKTLVLTLRALCILLSGKANPYTILMTTFTEKAAFEMRDRIHQYAEVLGYKGPLHEMRIGTINSFCDDVIRQFISDTPLKKNYEVLDALTQNLFIEDNFGQIVTDPMNIDNRYFNRWNSRWRTIREIIPYFNRIAEESIDIQTLSNNENQFLVKLAEAYSNYKKTMYAANRIDFSHQQKIVCDLLQKQQICQKIKQDIKYIMVDEYQDTNFIQERILLQLASPTNNICVVGDEDQSLYRFRGATTRNILEFQSHFSESNRIILDINYRSHPKIIDICNCLMRSVDWSDPSGQLAFRSDKTVRPDPEVIFSEYPAVFSVRGTSPNNEGKRVAHLIKYLKENNIIEDYNQVALLLHSVRLDRSEHYSQALDDYSIPYYIPRAKAFFYNEEVQLMIGCYAILFGFDAYAVANLNTPVSDTLISYTNDALRLLNCYFKSIPKLAQYIHERVKGIVTLKRWQTTDMHITDYFYELISIEPFHKFLKEEGRARNLATVSQLLTTFQIYYHIDLVTGNNYKIIPEKLFTNFLKFLLDYGIDDYEDPNDPIPSGHVQIMTVHQSKGLQFPVVIVGSLNDKKYASAQIDNHLKFFYKRPSFEPENRITEFDSIREYYVAFSRAAELLILTTTGQPNQYVAPVWNTLNPWPDVETQVLQTLNFKSRKHFVPKKTYSLTRHINVFEVCPRQYQLYREYEFSPSRSAATTFGTLVHQTIEDIHKIVLEGKIGDITNEAIRDTWFEYNYQNLMSCGMRPLSTERKYAALDHILDYFNQNYDNLQRIIQTEVDVSVEKSGYILAGRIDLLLGIDGNLEVLDFKTRSKPEEGDPVLQYVYLQLCIYAHILKERYGKNPSRFYIYWTAEPDRNNALVKFRLSENDIQSSVNYFDSIVEIIKKKDFEVRKTPDSRVCGECDFRTYCSNEGIITFKRKGK